LTLSIRYLSMGLPHIVCRTFGKEDFILVPSPAARIIVAIFFIITWVIYKELTPKSAFIIIYGLADNGKENYCLYCLTRVSNSKRS
jgi:TRAP-type C4-dicarboxylate transport system permease large subunit